MKSRLCILAVVLAAITVSSAQVASHASASKMPAASAPALSAPVASLKPAARVNGAVLTDTDVLRVMYDIFPYAQQHKGFPKDLEADIRKGALEMVIFEELLYQEAKRRNLTIAPERLTRAEAGFRNQFPDKATYARYIAGEFKGDKALVREKIRRSLLIERMLKSDVAAKSVVTLAEMKANYDKNSVNYLHGETLSIQTISIIPPPNSSKEIQAESKAKIKDIARLGRAAKTKRDFGLIAEQLSDDDWRTKLGDRGTLDVKNLPPEIVKAARTMKAGQVSDPVQLERAWVVFRLNAHKAAGKTPFAEVKSKLKSDMQKQKTSETRASLNKQLRKDAKIEVL